MTDERLGMLMVQYRGALLRYLRARGAGDEAEDMVQDVWLKVGVVDPRSIDDVRSYVFRVAHNLMLDRARERRRRSERERVFRDLYSSAETGSKAAAPEQELIAREHLARIERALADLGTRTDMIFRRHRVDGVAQRDIAMELGISLSAVEKQLQKAYRAIAAEERAYQAEKWEQPND